jgi:predicted RND superfamily exporter protein
VKKLISFTTDYPKLTIAVALVITLLFVSQFPRIKIDTDPENMLASDEPVRVAHRNTKSTFSLYDMLVIGIVEEGTHGVFKPDTLKRIASITDEILKVEGVIIADVISPTTTDDIQVKKGVLNIDKLVLSVPETLEEAALIKKAALDNPILKNMLISEDGKAIALYVPIESKEMSYKISQQLKEIIEKNKGEEEYYITGLPVAEDTFGVEMFKQMAISAPLAGLVIFILMYLFFRRFSLIISPMIVAMFTVVWTMGLLIGAGFTVHIMSSMIPIFLMPIAVVDSIHILSDFHERYDPTGGRKETILAVIDDLFKPMLYTSITTSVGFASLALTPIPPVQIFGLFVAFGIMLAWILTLTLIPSYTMLVPERFLKGFGKGEQQRERTLTRAINRFGTLTLRWAKPILLFTFLTFVLSWIGISFITINDNPVKWFEEKHPIRVADRVLNAHFGGSYMAYLVLEGTEPDMMKDPVVMSYIHDLQIHLNAINVVGKTTTAADIVKKIGYELHDEDSSYDSVPDSRDTIAQYLFLYEMSGDPQDLYHLVDYDYTKANIWIQLKRGDNKDMSTVEKSVEAFMINNPPPDSLKASWAGLTYLNIAWQEKMVWGMLKSLLSSFVIVFILMVLLFRSFLWGLISMIPLTVTISFIYGLIGFIGKDYDMPVAVLSALTLGLSIDFAIHFVQRAKQIYEKIGNWQETSKEVFKEPVMAIVKNAVIIAVGFTPLLLASLVPYQTVGFFLASIMFLSGATTLTIMPSIVTVLQKRLFKRTRK